MIKSRVLLCLLLTTAAPILGLEVVGTGCYEEEGVTYAVLELDASAEVGFSTELTERPSLGLVVYDCELEGAGRLAEAVGLAAGGGYEARGDDAVFFLYPAAGAGSYRVYLARDPWRAVLEILPGGDAGDGGTAVEVDENDKNDEIEDTYPRPPDLSDWTRGAILLVDDDDGPNNGNRFGVDAQERYIGALETLGAPYELRVVSHHANGPSAVELARYEVVVYFTAGDAYKVCLSAADRRNLRSYLDNGGRLLLISQNYLDQVRSSGSAGAGSLAEALGVARWTGDVCSTIALGEPYHEINAGLSLELFGSRYNVGCWGDGLELNDRGEPVFSNLGTGDYCGVAVAAPGYRSVFFSFAWVNTVVDEEAVAVLGRALEWLAR
jgi:hypothetical protein